jgi:hypothetical protein
MLSGEIGSLQPRTSYAVAWTIESGATAQNSPARCAITHPYVADGSAQEMRVDTGGSGTASTDGNGWIILPEVEAAVDAWYEAFSF